MATLYGLLVAGKQGSDVPDLAAASRNRSNCQTSWVTELHLICLGIALLMLLRADPTKRKKTANVGSFLDVFPLRLVQSSNETNFTSA
jgi:hypothetical protein